MLPLPEAICPPAGPAFAATADSESTLAKSFRHDPFPMARATSATATRPLTTRLQTRRNIRFIGTRRFIVLFPWRCRQNRCALQQSVGVSGQQLSGPRQCLSGRVVRNAVPTPSRWLWIAAVTDLWPVMKQRAARYDAGAPSGWQRCFLIPAYLPAARADQS